MLVARCELLNEFKRDHRPTAAFHCSSVLVTLFRQLLLLLLLMLRLLLFMASDKATSEE